MATRDLEWRPAPAPGPPALYLRESSSQTAGPREEGLACALASLKAALARPGSRILARAAKTLASTWVAAQLEPGMPAFELLSCLRHHGSNH